MTGEVLRHVATSLAALAIIAAGFLGSPSKARAQTMHRSPHTDETNDILGIKGGFVASFNDGNSFQGGSLSPFYERNVIQGWLEIEAALAFTFIETERVIGFDLFAKKPFHVSHVINPYVGVGPNLSILRSEEEGTTRTRFGILATAGSYFWFAEGQWGLDTEVVYLVLFDSLLIHELTFEVGPVFRF